MDGLLLKYSDGREQAADRLQDGSWEFRTADLRRLPDLFDGRRTFMRLNLAVAHRLRAYFREASDWFTSKSGSIPMSCSAEDTP